MIRREDIFKQGNIVKVIDIDDFTHYMVVENDNARKNDYFLQGLAASNGTPMILMKI